MKHFSSPAYTIGKKFPAEPMTTNKLTPSPDSYNIRNEELITPVTKFGKALRKDLADKST